GAEELREPRAVADELLRTPGTILIATSRTVLDHPAEVIIPLAGLDTTPDGAAVELFRVLATEQSIEIADLATVQAIVARIGGSPLGIRLCVGLAETMRLGAVLAHLRPDGGHDVGPADVLPVTAVLESTVRWSEERLSEPARRLLGILSVF